MDSGKLEALIRHLADKKKLPLPEAGSLCDSGEPSDQRAQLLGDAALTEVQHCAEHGDVVALNEMGRRYGLGQEVPVDAEKSFHYYERAAQFRGAGVLL